MAKRKGRTRPRADRRRSTTVGDVAAQVARSAARVVRQGDQTVVSVDFDRLPPAEWAFAADCARATLNDGYPELQLGQRHRFGERPMTRLVVVRYEVSRFAQRAEANESFRVALEGFLEERSQRDEVGYFVRAFERASIGSEALPPVAIIDAELEFVSRVELQTGIIFVSADARERLAIARASRETLDVTASVEATMPARVLADLLRSWKDLADELAT